MLEVENDRFVALAVPPKYSLAKEGPNPWILLLLS